MQEVNQEKTKHIAERIRRLRIQNDWSQEYMADQLGLSITGYGNIERGATDPSFSRLEQISKLFKISLAELVSDTPDQETASARLYKTLMEEYSDKLAELRVEHKKVLKELEDCKRLIKKK